jgi:hypothetical protein
MPEAPSVARPTQNKSITFVIDNDAFPFDVCQPHHRQNTPELRIQGIIKGLVYPRFASNFLNSCHKPSKVVEPTHKEQD